MKQLCQAEAPLDYGRYSARRGDIMPGTPEKNWKDKQVRDQHLKRDIPTPPPSDVVNKAAWLPRREVGVPRIGNMPPPAADVAMFQSVDQLRSEPHTDVMSARFAYEHTAARMSGSQTARLTADEKRHQSCQRLEATTVRDVTSWPWQSDKLTRHDPFHVKPMQRSGNSSVKHDIISNRRRDFWY